MRGRIRLALPQTATARIVVGLDVSLTGTGICVVSGNPHVAVGKGLTVESTLIEVGKTLRGPTRLSAVCNAVLQWLKARGVGVGTTVAMEGYGFSSQMAHSLGEIGGCIRLSLYLRGCNLLIIPPTTLKKYLTGKGVGQKNVVMKHVHRRWGFDVDDDNQTDAFGCAIVGLLDTQPEICTAVEKVLLAEKVERYAGAGQNWGGDIPGKLRKRRSRKTED